LRFVQLAVFAQLVQDFEAVLRGRGRVGREGDACEWRPEVFAEGGRDGLFAIVGELFEGVVVLGGRC
jgi:hypothetical protein